jgi:hypothetical protein
MEQVYKRRLSANNTSDQVNYHKIQNKQNRSSDKEYEDEHDSLNIFNNYFLNKMEQKMENKSRHYYVQNNLIDLSLK